MGAIFETVRSTGLPDHLGTQTSPPAVIPRVTERRSACFDFVCLEISLEHYQRKTWDNYLGKNILRNFDTSFQKDESVEHTVLAVCKAPKIRPNFHFVGTMAVKFIKTPV